MLRWTPLGLASVRKEASSVQLGNVASARVVAFTDENGANGHTVVEVWSAQHQKWVLIDSNAPLLVESENRLASVADCLRPGVKTPVLLDMHSRARLTDVWPDRLRLLQN